MVEAEQPEGLSARKLVVETEKHNVLTAYNAEVGMHLLKRFPNVDVILVHQELLKHRSGYLAEIKKHSPNTPIILASPLANTIAPEADFVVDSFQPHELLDLLNSRFDALNSQ